MTWHQDTSWNSAEPDLSGRRAVVTGANAGLGRLTAQYLARCGMDVTLAVRRTDAGEQAAERIRQDRPPGTVRVARLDLADLASVREFSDGQGELDLLVNNAGLMMVPSFRTTSDGFETQMGVNHLGHFALTALLWPKLSPQSRVVSVSSIAHRSAKHLDRSLSAEGKYTPMGAYGQSKLAQLLFTAELTRRLKAAGDDRMAVAAHPGWSATAEEPPRAKEPLPVAFSRKATAVLGTKPAHGVRPQLHAAVATDVSPGDFWGPRLLIGGKPHLAAPSKAARDDEDAAWLWAESEKVTGVTFSP